MKARLNKCILLILLIICMLSCERQVNYHSWSLPTSDKFMNLDTTRFNVDYSVIKLQDGSGDTLLGCISKVVAADEKLYILSNGGVYIFTADGAFLKKLQQGRGPK